ncbi:MULTISPECIES: hypothetical protein [Rhodococcus]|uniref:ESX-1 secretion-associated protein n=1 Tax=Rhodococcus rhodochrous TaxID=1829 RepID=A0AAW4XC70_RHORH|nr:MULTISPECIES: hypothetical protein [Rhodococcus]KLL95082.1 hypothetical protein NJ76_30315 [Rhodococcus sp. IITR03]MCD2110631.1 hypothetical protein [Rhodococcus rhodochrous]QHG82705.1 hypothetical protein D1O33_12640 [Rhodococcus rhodochrous]QOH57614.1 hypothetical protein C6Y44_17825 [Rhodococcus rhodochrous]WAL45233.1 hypothetical protein OQN32_17335 [Rhodococcus pyridinivorans]
MDTQQHDTAAQHDTATQHGTIRFDDEAVRAVAARLAEVAEDADAGIRRGFGGLVFDGGGAGSTHRAAGVRVETGYRRMRAACESWAATVQAHADALRVVADTYRHQDDATVIALTAVTGADLDSAGFGDAGTRQP